MPLLHCYRFASQVEQAMLTAEFGLSIVDEELFIDFFSAKERKDKNETSRGLRSSSKATE
jgi:hypothetical protein